MPADIKPLFRPEAVRPKVKAFTPPDAAVVGRSKLVEWAKFFATSKADKRKETELLADFLRDVFVGILGYVPPPAERYSLKKEVLVPTDQTFADAAVGHFDGDADRVVMVLEGKGPKDPIDRPHAGRRLSAVEQAYRYAINLPCDWIIVTNIRQIRLYHKGSDQQTYELFEVERLARDDAHLSKFVFLLGCERVIPSSGRCHFYELLSESARAQSQPHEAIWYARELLAIERVGPCPARHAIGHEPVPRFGPRQAGGEPA